MIRVVIVVALVPVGTHRSYPSQACSSPGSCLDITIGCAATDATHSNLSGIVLAVGDKMALNNHGISILLQSVR
jgi:hypothetical protein